MPDDIFSDPQGINGLPVAGDFDGNPANGDEVGLFDGSGEVGLGDLSFFAAKHDRIQIDSTAAGYGWFVDETPGDDLEFTFLTGSQQFTATVATAAHGRVDLLTAVMHELGHVLGWEHTEDDGVMRETLSPGIRQTMFDDALAASYEAAANALVEDSPLSIDAVDVALAAWGG